MSYCQNCGGALDDKARYCPECGESVERPQQAPARAAADHREDGSTATSTAAEPLQVAGLGRRAVAQIIDLFIVLALFWIIGSNVAGVVGGTTETGFQLEGGPALLVMGLTFVAAVAYFSVLEAYWHGQTLGKRVLGIRVADVTGAPCGFGQALMRNVLRLVDGLALYVVGLVVALVSERRQRVGDRVAGTVVLRGVGGERAHEPADKDARRSKVRFSMGRGGDVDI